MEQQLKAHSVSKAYNRHEMESLLPTVLFKKIPPEVFWHFFPNGWEFFLSIFYTPIIRYYLR